MFFLDQASDCFLIQVRSSELCQDFDFFLLSISLLILLSLIGKYPKRREKRKETHLLTKLSSGQISLKREKRKDTRSFSFIDISNVYSVDTHKYILRSHLKASFGYENKDMSSHETYSVGTSSLRRWLNELSLCLTS